MCKFNSIEKKKIIIPIQGFDDSSVSLESSQNSSTVSVMSDTMETDLLPIRCTGVWCRVVS